MRPIAFAIAAVLQADDERAAPAEELGDAAAVGDDDGRSRGSGFRSDDAEALAFGMAARRRPRRRTPRAGGSRRAGRREWTRDSATNPLRAVERRQRPVAVVGPDQREVHAFERGDGVDQEIEPLLEADPAHAQDELLVCRDTESCRARAARPSAAGRGNPFGRVSIRRRQAAARRAPAARDSSRPRRGRRRVRPARRARDRMRASTARCESEGRTCRAARTRTACALAAPRRRSASSRRRGSRIRGRCRVGSATATRAAASA